MTNYLISFKENFNLLLGSQYPLAFGVAVGLLIFFYFFHHFLIRQIAKTAAKTATKIDDVLIAGTKSIRFWFYTVIALYLALLITPLPENYQIWINRGLVLLATYQIIRVAIAMVNRTAEIRLVKEDADPAAKNSALDFSRKLVNAGLWLLGVLFILSNLGVNITSVVAGLGIGGVAIALAVQNILGDLFSSFAIYFDKPFVVGDFIVVGEHRGIVERIGIKTTRIRSISGEELVISNRELTSARINNFKRLAERRAIFTIGVAYETPQAKLEAIPQLIEKIIKAAPNTRFERAYFKEFGPSSLDFEIVYFVLSSEYKEFVAVQQTINFAINREFNLAGLSFAYPTQTLYLNDRGG